MKTVRRPPYPKWNPGYFPCSSLTPLPLSSRRPSVSFGGFGLNRCSPDQFVYSQIHGVSATVWILTPAPDAVNFGQLLENHSFPDLSAPHYLEQRVRCRRQFWDGAGPLFRGTPIAIRYGQLLCVCPPSPRPGRTHRLHTGAPLRVLRPSYGERAVSKRVSSVLRQAQRRLCRTTARQSAVSKTKPALFGWSANCRPYTPVLSSSHV